MIISLFVALPRKVSGKVKRVASGGALLLLAAAAACPRGIMALGLSGGALTSAGEWATGSLLSVLVWFVCLRARISVCFCAPPFGFRK